MAERPLLLGHRGVCGFASVRENTFPAFDLALSQGCDGFEFDVRMTADGAAVICHDAKFKRVVIRRRAAAELPELPSLDALLRRYAERAFLDIEIKEPGLGKAVLAALAKWPPQRGYVISSFLPEILAEMRRMDGSAPFGLIANRRKELARWRDLPVEYVIPHWLLVTAHLIHELHEAGKKVLVWTVNDRVKMRRMADWKVDGVISDRTELLTRTLGIRGQA